MAKLQSAMVDIIRQMSTDANGLNMKCYSGLLKLLDRDRLDIIQNIRRMINSDPGTYTPELFAKWLADVDKLIRRYDFVYDKKFIQSAYDDIEYEQKKIAYDLGESDENPDE